MEKNVIISIKGEHSYPGQEQEVTELITAGMLADCGDDGFTLSYQESEVTGLEGTLTTIQVEPRRVTLVRVGAVNSQMVFEEGRRHFSMYDTPYGALEIGINTRKMRTNFGKSGGDIFIDYGLEIDHGAVGDNRFQINVRESGAQTIRQ